MFGNLLYVFLLSILDMFVASISEKQNQFLETAETIYLWQYM